MEPLVMPRIELDESDEEVLVHAWRAEQLRRLGPPGALAETFAALVDWHEIATLVEHGCASEIAW